MCLRGCIKYINICNYIYFPIWNVNAWIVFKLFTTCSCDKLSVILIVQRNWVASGSPDLLVCQNDVCKAWQLVQVIGTQGRIKFSALFSTLEVCSPVDQRMISLGIFLYTSVRRVFLLVVCDVWQDCRCVMAQLLLPLSNWFY